MRLRRANQVEYLFPVHTGLFEINRINRQAFKPQVHGVTGGIEINALWQSLCLDFANQHPSTAVRMISQPSDLVRPKLDGVAAACLQLNKMEKAFFVTQQKVGDAGHCPRFKPSALDLPGAFLDPRLHRPPQVCFSLYGGFGNCPVLRE